MRGNLKRNLRLLVVTAIAIGGLVIGANPANAAGTYLYRTNGGSIFMTQKVSTSASGILIRSGTSARMICWTTGPNTNFFGNYWTAKYFKVTAYTTAGARTGYVTASVVANQTVVGHC